MMTKNQLIDIIIRLLEPDGDIDFLLKLDEDDLELLVGYIRERVDRAGGR